MVAVSFVLALSMLLSIVSAAQVPPAFELLAFDCVELNADESSVVQIEREGFPPFSDTGLFASNGQQIAYVEQGTVVLYGDRIGKMDGGEGVSVVADTTTSLGIRNEGLTAASVLWARIVPALDRSQAAADVTSGLFAAPLTGAPLPDEPGLPTVFFEFELPDSSATEQAYLFLARLDFDRFTGLGPDEERVDFTTSGIVAIVVESGTVRVDGDDVAGTVPAGEGMAVPGEGRYAFTPDGSPAVAFLVGVVEATDPGLVRTEIERSRTTDRLCPPPEPVASPAP